MKRKSFEDMACPVAQSLEIVGEWWTPLILRDILLKGLNRFDDIQRSLDIAPTVLTSRLNHLVDNGLLERRQYSDRPPRSEYIATEAAEDFVPVLKALAKWGDKWTTVPSETVPSETAPRS
ncbi:MAG: DNA-binding HxlR family transcriptional regulator [Candidatus Poriferisodalaceae bacterium]|jgi:DNA-binding HxlR family transcriptional regulator